MCCVGISLQDDFVFVRCCTVKSSVFDVCVCCCEIGEAVEDVWGKGEGRRGDDGGTGALACVQLIWECWVYVG